MKVVIIGNSGSGKTTLAKKISENFSINHLNLDEAFWEPGQYKRSRPHRKMVTYTESIASKDSWVIEGIYTHIISTIIDNANSLIWLDLAEDKCIRSLFNRDTEPSEFQLIRATEYFHRKSGSSYASHLKLWNKFDGIKYRFTDFVDEIEFLGKGKEHDIIR